MPKRKSSELRNSSITVENIEHLDLDSMTNEEINEMFDNRDESLFVNIPVVPDDVDSGDESNHENESSDDVQIIEGRDCPVGYQRIDELCTASDKKLEPSHRYVWKDGEKLYDSTPKSEIYLDDETKQNLRDKTCVELFELFFQKK